MAVELNSYNEILGKLIRKMIADSPVNDLSSGSALLTLLEAVASNDFDNSTAVLSVLETLNIDAIRNADLDTRAADYGLSRKSSAKATGFISIGNSLISKRATSLYAVKPPPIAGSTIVYVNNAANWLPTGSLYIGRGTQQFEGPINYTSVVNNGSFFTITLASALQKDHLSSDSIIDAQGTVDSLIPAGTIVSIPSNNQNPEVRYTVLRDSILPSGEDKVSNIAIAAEQAGIQSNTGINTIIAFGAAPFVGATVSNTSVLTDGADAESDDDLRERIKSYSSTLARGTREAILSAILNVSDATDGKQVASAVVTEPAEIGDPSIVYIDDGSGFQPSYLGQPIDILLSSATGNEEFLQLANFPLPRPQVINAAEGPYLLTDGMKLRVKVDITEEEVIFSSSQFVNIASATIPEIVVAINDQAVNFRARLTENSSRILLSTLDDKAETIQVLPIRSTDSELEYSNFILSFPTNEFSYIKLYRNNTLLRSTQISATVISSSFSSWGITGPGNLILQVDNTPAQNVSFSTLDFDGNPFLSLDIGNWVAAFNSKFAGITATATSSGKITFVSNKDGALSAIAILGGSYLAAMFGTNALSNVGQNADFALNRQTGNLQLKFTPAIGDTIAAGSLDSKGFSQSIVSGTGVFNLSTDAQGRASQLVAVIDGDAVLRNGVSLVQGNTITIQDMTNGVMRILCNSSSSFAAAQLNDYIWISNRGDIAGGGSWIALSSCGIYRIVKKGDHLVTGVDTWIEVLNASIIAGGPYSIQDTNDIRVFQSETYPQVWNTTASVPTPASASLQSIVDTASAKLKNVLPTIFKTNTIKLSSSTENGGSIGIPVSTGRISNIIPATLKKQTGNPSHKASKISSRDLIGNIRTGGISSQYLDRSSYTSTEATLDSSVSPGIEGVDQYSELLSLDPASLSTSLLQLDDILVTGVANNSKLIRSIKEIQPGNDVGTQYSKPTTVVDHIIGDKISVTRPMSIAPDDSAVFVLDRDLVTKTINVNFWRTGKINTQYVASTTAFSADDIDNEPGINFGSPAVWDKVLSGAEFKDYGVMFKARNWYRTGGAANAAGATMILRSKEYGRAGNNYRFKLEYPSTANQPVNVSHSNFPNWSVVSCTLGSGVSRNTGIISGTTFKVSSSTPDVYRYTFQEPYVDFTSVQPNDVVSIQAGSGISGANSGQFSILAVDTPGKWIDVYSPNGVISSVGVKEVSQVATIADIFGSPQITDITCTAEGATASTVGSTEYFTLYDDIGMVVFWYDINNAGASAPTVAGASRYVEISTVLTGDVASVVASKTAVIVDSDAKFLATALGSVVSVTNSFNGPVTLGAAGPNTGFVVALGTAGIANNSIGGKYFRLNDRNGSVAVWFNVNSEPEPPHGALRSIQVSITAGDSANTVASKIAATVNADIEYSASSASNLITITDDTNGSRADITSNTSGFTTSVLTQGVDDGVEIVSISNLLQIFPLAENDCQTVCNTISTSQLINAVPVGNPGLLFEKATREDTYSYSGNGSALAFDHDPSPISLKNSYVSFWDGYSFVKIFENTNPQFVLKKDMVLPGVVPAIYAMASCPNFGTTDVGEFFKLTPKTIDNVKHHLSHKALSQLPLVASVDIAGNYRKIQIKSKKLGTDGAVEMVGGRANAANFAILGDGQVASQLGVNYTEIKTSAFPSSMQIGDYVEISNNLPAKRKSRLQLTDSIDVVNISGSNFEYRLNPKITNSGPSVPWTIADVSASYSRPAGAIWRWTHAAAGSVSNITASINGSVLNPPTDYQESGTPDTPAISIVGYVNGSVSTPTVFGITVSVIPASRDYIVFENTGGTKYAVWFDLSGSDPLPSGATFLAVLAGNRIRVDISGALNAGEVIDLLQIELASSSSFNSSFSSIQSGGMSLANVKAGDLLAAKPIGPFSPSGFLGLWDGGNLVKSSGDGKISGLPIIAVNSVSRYVDVVNPWGKAMGSQVTGSDGKIDFIPAVSIKWNLAHRSRTKVISLIRSAGVATAITDSDHGLNPGDSFVIEGAGTVTDGTYVVANTVSAISFSFASAGSDTSNTGVITRGAVSDVTNYRIEKLGFNGINKLNRVSGPSPRFIDLGVAVDDYISITGSTFASSNNGFFRVLAVDNDSILFENKESIEQLHAETLFNETSSLASWTGAGLTVNGSVGSFRRVQVGDWVKKTEDSDMYYTQVSAISPSPGALATSLTLLTPYPGLTGSAEGIKLNQVTGVNAGVPLRNINDIQVFEGDAAYAGDSLVVENIVATGWFNTGNSGVRKITSVGSTSEHVQFMRVSNAGGLPESSRSMSAKLDGFYVLESLERLYKTVRLVNHNAISPSSSAQRVSYLTPSDRVYKISDLYQSQVSVIGKIGIDVSVTTGVDGYSYYIGLMRTVQRIIDGFEPDPANFPGRRAIGGIIEVLPPLIRTVAVSINVTTRDGVNLTDITNDIKSAIIGYVNSLSVGGDVILSEIIARVMAISGVAAVTFTSPLPSVERIAVADDAKAYISPEAITVA